MGSYGTLNLFTALCYFCTSIICPCWHCKQVVLFSLIKNCRIKIYYRHSIIWFVFRGWPIKMQTYPNWGEGEESCQCKHSPMNFWKAFPGLQKKGCRNGQELWLNAEKDKEQYDMYSTIIELKVELRSLINPV